MDFLGDLWDGAKDLISGGGEAVGSALGAVGGAAFGPLGSAGGGAIGGALGGAVEDGIDWLLGGDDSSGGGTETRSPGLMPAGPGGGLPGAPGAQAPQAAQQGSSPNQPGGALQGPVYGTQGMAELMPYVKQVLQILATNPQIGKLVQRFWDFPRGEQVRVQNSPLAWSLMAKQLPQHMRDALEQFSLGLCSPMGLTTAGEDAFKLLLIAEAGYEPQAIGLCKFAEI